MSSCDQPKVIDLFCGAGGLSLGLSQAGFEVVYALDNDPDSIATYSANLGNHAHCSDVAQTTRASIEQQNVSTDSIDLVAGGPPCQGFSVQRRGANKDPRNLLVLEYLRLVLEIRPSFFLMENVAGLLSVRGQPFMEQFRAECVDHGYELLVQKLNASHFGVPQNRVRAFLVGRNLEKTSQPFLLPDPIERYITSPTTVRKAIESLASKSSEEVPNHKGDRLSPINLARIRSIKAGQGRDSLPPDLQLPCHKKGNGHRHLDTYGRMAWDEPAPTITARFDSFSRGRFGHPELDRSITLREGARLQSFPDDFEFLGNKVSVARQIGNAVPPLLGEALGQAILRSINLSAKEVA